MKLIFRKIKNIQINWQFVYVFCEKLYFKLKYVLSTNEKDW